MFETEYANRWSLLSWISPLIALGLVAFLITSSVGHAATTQQICTLSSFFSFDSDTQATATIHIEGRGLATCRSDQGVVADIPVFADLEATVIAPLANSGELTFSSNSSAFVVPRELAQLQDRFTVRTYGFQSTHPDSPTMIFHGSQNDLVIQMKLTSSTQAFQKVSVKAITLRFDESAPTLE